MCVIDIFSTYELVINLKDKKGITIFNAFQKILDELKRKPNKIWVGNGSEVYNKSMKSCLEKSNTEMYSTHSGGKSAVAKRYMKTLKNDIYNHMIVASKKCV